MSDDYYGIGMINGYPIDEEFIRKRPKHIKGPLVINDKSFTAASGSARAYGCPWGTFILTSQGIGSIIARLYRRFKIDPNEEGFRTVWNVGLPNSPTGIGYDFPCRRRRGAIQIHCDPNLRSLGCIVLNREQFLELGQEIGEQNDDLAIELLPAEDGANFRIFKRPKFSPK